MYNSHNYNFRSSFTWCCATSCNWWCRYGNSCIYQHERYTNRPRFQRYNNTDIPPPSRTNRQEITDVHLGSRLPPDKQDVATTTSSIHTSYRKSTENNGQFCRFYRQNSWCPFGFGCRFVHERHSSWRGSNKEKRWGSSSFQSSIPKSKESRRVCDYFKRGKCHYGENCKYEHLRDLQVEQGRVECDNGKLELQSSETCDVLEELVVPVEDDKEKATVVVKPESLKHGIDVIDLNDADLQKLRDVEISQLKKRFTKDKLVEHESGDKFTVVVSSTDPDWPYDVRDVVMTVFFPCAYPKECLVIEVDSERNDILPGALLRHINEVVKTWLTLKHQANSESGKVELVFRPFLRWFDRSMEEHFTLGLRKAKQELMVEDVGVEFVPYETLFDSQKTSENISNLEDEGKLTDFPVIPDGIENNVKSDANQDNTDNNSASEGIRRENNDMINLNQDTKIVRKGTEIKLCNMQLGVNVALVHCQKLSITVECSRCKTHHDINTGPRRKNVFSCSKCRTSQQLTFRPSIIHQLSAVLGYLDVKECLAFDLLLVSCVFSVTCLSCDRNMSSDGFHYGKTWQSWCHNCNAKLEIYIESTKFQVLQPNHIFESGPSHVIKLEKREKKVKDPSIQEGNPLPSNGTCKHYKKSFRWFRFPCCGKAYPCDLCHNEKELNHEMKLANRIICGFCGKEQPILNNKPCMSCSSSMIKLTKSYWEGGKGCRDKSKMSRDDYHKYSGTAKTTSRKATEKEKPKKKK